MRRILTVLLLAVCLIQVLQAQVETGIYQFGAFDTKGFDTVNLGNLNVHFAIPVFHKPGRAGLDFINDLVYDGSIWTPVGTSGSKVWQPAARWGWSPDVSAITGDLSFHTTTVRCIPTIPPTFEPADNRFIYTDTKGTAHTFGPLTEISYGSCTNILGVPTSGTFPATDNSGLVLVANSYHNYQVQFPNGSIIYPTYNANPSAVYASDTNGNSITSTGTIFTDTTGTTVLTLTGSGNASSPRLLTYPTYVGGSASTGVVTVHYGTYTIQTGFGCSGISEYSASSVSLVDYVELDDHEEYQFLYEAGPSSGTVTGRIDTVTLPTGGRIHYSYTGGSNGIVCQDGGTATLTRSMLDDPLTPSVSYARTPGASSAPTTETIVVDGLSNHALYDFVNDPADPYSSPFVINHIQYQGSGGTALLSEQSCLNGASPDCTTQGLSLPISQVSKTTLLDGSSTTKKQELFYNLLENITEDKEYDFASGSSGSLLTDTKYTYIASGTPVVQRLLTVKAYDGSSNAIQSVLYGYDQTTPSTTSSLPNHGSVSATRGNLTSVTFDTVLGNAAVVASQYTYDDAGQILTSQDAKSNTTTYSYDSATDTFLLGTSMPTTGGVTHSTSSTYDVPSGVTLSDTDQNTNTTSYTYDDMLRPLSATTPGSGSISYAYSLGPTTPHTSTGILHATGGSYITTTNYLDPYGRRSEIDSTDTPSDDLVDYAYDANGNVGSVSNPYRSGGSVAYTATAYDALGRPTTITDSDGSSEVHYTYSGNSTTVADEASKQRKVIVDGLGRTAMVLEPDASNSLTLETDYLYNQNFAAGSGSTVTTYQSIVHQKGGSGSSSDWRTRTFTYDMLGRALTATTPEAGTTTYTYPSGSGSCAGVITLLCSRTDAYATSSTYAYDALNRLTGKTYGGSSIGTGTSSVGYSYDQASYNGLTITNGIGLRTGMSDGSGNTAWSFDGMGRVAAIRKTVNSVTKQANYTYNADGTTNTVQDFGGTTFTYSYDVSGRPTGIVDGSSNTYANSAVYNAAGLLTSLNHQLTSGGGAYVRSLQYNNRLQPSVISATLGASTIQSLSYGYGTGGTNNGNILAIANGMDSTGHRDQTYSYDNLNRLASGRDGTHWGETYTYDPWGNLYQTTQMSGLGGNNWTATANGNNQLSILTYDTTGEVTQDNFGNNYTYDAEGRILTAGGGAYVYDGDGNRVEKTVSSTTTLYWPGAGSILDESNSSGSTMGKQVQFAGLLVWHEDTSGTGHFLFQDQLGSTRISGDASGTLADDNDYQSFGALYNNYGSSSGNHYVFTGYESDSESSTDYATFRNLSLSMGRFNRPDPYDGSYDSSNPQSLNRYSYVADNPLVFVDPFGTCTGTNHGDPCPVVPNDPIPVDNCGLPGSCIVDPSQPVEGGGGRSPGGGGGAPGGGGGGKPVACAKASPLQKAGIAAQAIIAKMTGKTIGVGLAGSAGAGLVGIGLSTNGSAQMVVQPNGRAALVYSVSFPSAGYLSTSPGQGEDMGGAANIGFTLSVSGRGPSSGGWSLDGSYQNVGVGLTTSGGSLTLGVGVGARASAGLNINFNLVIPVCP